MYTCFNVENEFIIDYSVLKSLNIVEPIERQKTTQM